ncbi:MAG TPA: ATP-binding protein [Xanthomonadaceae bacterium]|nr:ATP-binding protein [Xanthomonadaceae bacterium]
MAEHRDFEAQIAALIAAQIASRPASYACQRHGRYSTIDAEGLRTNATCPQCQAESNAAEHEFTNAWIDWRFWSAAQIPRRFQNRTLANWTPTTPNERKVLQHLRAWLEDAHVDRPMLAILGAIGTGKTHLLAGIAAHVAPQGVSVRYVSLPDLFASLRAAMNDRSGRSPEDIIGDLEDVELLLLDEIGTGSGSDYEARTLTALLDRRYRDETPVVIAGNITPANLPDHLGDRAADRWNEAGVTLVLTGQSRRKQAGTDAALRDAPPAFERPPEALRLTVTDRGEPQSSELYWHGPQCKRRRIYG